MKHLKRFKTFEKLSPELLKKTSDKLRDQQPKRAAEIMKHREETLNNTQSLLSLKDVAVIVGGYRSKYSEINVRGSMVKFSYMDLDIIDCFLGDIPVLILKNGEDIGLNLIRITNRRDARKLIDLIKDKTGEIININDILIEKEVVDSKLSDTKLSDSKSGERLIKLGNRWFFK
jgi:predicted hydrocarbon binding protein